MDEFGQFLQGLITEGGGTLGVVSWAATAGVIKFWVDWLGKPEMSNQAKRWVSLGVPVVLVAGAYFLGYFIGYWALDWNTAFTAGKVMVAEIAGAKTIFTMTKTVEAAVVTNKPQAIEPPHEIQDPQ